MTRLEQTEPENFPSSMAEVRQRLEQEYGPPTGNWSVELKMLAKLFGGNLSDLRGKIILDLGCGCKNAEFGEWGKNRKYEPWLARALVILGAHPVGIDIGDLSQEKFERHQLDLTQHGVLDFLPGQSFDAVHINALFTSPTFGETVRSQGKDPKKVCQELENQAKRLVKDQHNILMSQY